MTQSLTLARLPSAGENSKPPIYKQKKTKNERHFENVCFKGEKFEELKRKKKQKQYSRPFKKPQEDSRTPKPSSENGFCQQ